MAKKRNKAGGKRVSQKVEARYKRAIAAQVPDARFTEIWVSHAGGPFAKSTHAHEDIHPDNIVTHADFKDFYTIHVPDVTVQRSLVEEADSQAPRDAEYLFLASSRMKRLSEPPKTAEYLAQLLLPKENREALLGDLVEEYPGMVAKFGAGRAWFNFYVHVFFAIFILTRNAFVKWGLFGWVVEWIRKISS